MPSSPGFARCHRSNECPVFIAHPRRLSAGAAATRRLPSLRAALAAVLIQAEAPELTTCPPLARQLARRRPAGGRTASRRLRSRPSAVRVTAIGERRTEYTGFAHSILGRSAWEPTAWRAV